MAHEQQAPLERLNDPRAMLRLFTGMQLALIVGVFIGTWVKSATSTEPYLEVLVPYLLFTWLPTAIVIAVVGAIVLKRAQRVSGLRDAARADPTRL